MDNFSKLRILHVWDQAGVSCLLARSQRKLGHKADVIMREELSAGILEFYGFSNDLFPIEERINHNTGFRKFYDSLPNIFQWIGRKIKRKLRSFLFYLKVAKLAKTYDILHIHSVWTTVFFTLSKPKIIEWHGDDCRSSPSFQPHWKKWLVKLFIAVYGHFNKFYVSTPDLLADVKNSEHIPNPVDLQHWTRKKQPEPNTALYTHNWYEDGEHAKALAKKLNLKLTILDRRYPQSEWIPHGDLPAYMSQFEYFIDRKNIPSFSKTALEALALGMKVIQWDGKMILGLDLSHHPWNVAKRTIQIYRETLKK